MCREARLCHMLLESRSTGDHLKLWLVHPEHGEGGPGRHHGPALGDTASGSLVTMWRAGFLFCFQRVCCLCPCLF